MSVHRKYKDFKIFREPVCLIGSGRGHSLILDEEVLKQLNKIEEEFVIVAIAGPYRTGKSYLLNRLVGQNSGFPLGSTIESKTKGIWIWCSEHPNHSDKVLLLMDTEGLGDAKKGSSEHDVWILTLSILLSSTLVYNILSVMNEDAIETMNLVAEIAKKLLKSAKNDDGFPTFVLSLRDFFLDLIIDGKEITPDEYLENCLQLKPEHSENGKRYNSNRRSILECFKRRKCFTFDRPGSKATLKKIESIPDTELDKDFLERSLEFCRYIFSTSPVKMLTGKIPVNGPRFCQMTKSYVAAIKSGGVPSIQDAVESMYKIENHKAIEEACSTYLELVTQVVELPTVDEHVLQQVHLCCMGEAIDVFKTKAIMDENGEFQEKLMVRLTMELQNLEAMNVRLSEERCWTALNELNKKIESKMTNGNYIRKGGFHDYERDLTRVEEDYQIQPGLGLQAMVILSKFLSQKKSESQMLRKIDQSMTEQERRKTECERELAELERQKRENSILATEAQERQEAIRRNLKDIVALEERRRQEAMTSLREAMERSLQDNLDRQARHIRSRNESELESLRAQIRALR